MSIANKTRLLVALFVLLDLVFLRWVWIHFFNWGFWDWDYQHTLLETTRVSLVDYFQIPLWNPYIGGGATLAGNSLNHAWAPCFLPVLLLGTLSGAKICIFIYLLIGQLGMYLLARHRGLSMQAAFFSAILYTLGGIFAQRLTHGHFEWIAVAWVPFVVLMILKSIPRLSLLNLFLGGAFLAFIFLDGGPYQFVFFLVFLGVYSLLLAIAHKSRRPLVALAAILVIGSSLAAIKLFPVYEAVQRYPREITEDNFYGAPFKPTATNILHQSFLSRDQQHHKDLWMPYILNVGTYVGWIPLLLALGAILFRFKKQWPLIITALIFLYITLSSAVPFSLWDLLRKLPGLEQLRVPSRFNIFVLLALALLAGEGLRLLEKRVWKWVPLALIALTTADLLWVNGEVFKVAFSVPPIRLKDKGDFEQYYHPPYLEQTKNTVIYDTFPNWRSGAFSATLENRGVLFNYRAIPFSTYAVSFEDPTYRGEAFIVEGEGRVEEIKITPSTIHVKTNGLGRTLVVNQNHDPGWTCPDGLDIQSRYGLIAVTLPPGQREVELAYRPASFRWGAMISLASLIITLYVIIRGIRHRKGESDVSK